LTVSLNCLQARLGQPKREPIFVPEDSFWPPRNSIFVNRASVDLLLQRYPNNVGINIVREGDA